MGTKHAFLVGVDTYEDSSIRNLRFTVADAKGIAQALTTHAGFPEANVHVLTSDLGRGDGNYPSHTNVLGALERMTTAVGLDDTFVFYFAGHGIQDKNSAQFLIAADTVGEDADELRATALPMLKITEILGRINAAQNVIILDACRNNPLGDRSFDGTDSEFEDAVAGFDITRDLKPMAESRTRSNAAAKFAVLLAAQKGEKAVEMLSFGHGAFTHFLLQGFQNPDAREGQSPSGMLTAGSLSDYIERQMQDFRFSNPNVKQRPDYQAWGGSRITLIDGLALGEPDAPRAISTATVDVFRDSIAVLLRVPAVKNVSGRVSLFDRAFKDKPSERVIDLVEFDGDSMVFATNAVSRIQTYGGSALKELLVTSRAYLAANPEVVERLDKVVAALG